MNAVNEGVLSVEFFAAKDSDGKLEGLVVMAVPRRCGLMDGDTLRIDGLSMLAMRDRSVLPIDFATLTEKAVSFLTALVKEERRLAVGEFTPLGLVDAYFVNVVTT